MCSRLAILSVILVTLAACQSTPRDFPTAEECRQLNERNRDQCITGNP